MTRLAERKGELISMQPDGRGRVRLDYRIPARGLIGFRTEYLTATAGTGCSTTCSTDTHRGPSGIGQRINGVLVSMVQGKALAYTLFNLQERGSLFIGHGVEVYEGMIVGIHTRDNDLVVTRRRASSSPTSAPPAPTRTSFSCRRSGSRSNRRSSSSTTTNSSR